MKSGIKISFFLLTAMFACSNVFGSNRTKNDTIYCIIDTVRLPKNVKITTELDIYKIMSIENKDEKSPMFPRLFYKDDNHRKVSRRQAAKLHLTPLPAFITLINKSLDSGQQGKLRICILEPVADGYIVHPAQLKWGRHSLTY